MTGGGTIVGYIVLFRLFVVLKFYFKLKAKGQSTLRILETARLGVRSWEPNPGLIWLTKTQLLHSGCFKDLGPPNC